MKRITRSRWILFCLSFIHRSRTKQGSIVQKRRSCSKILCTTRQNDTKALRHLRSSHRATSIGTTIAGSYNISIYATLTFLWSIPLGLIFPLAGPLRYNWQSSSCTFVAEQGCDPTVTSSSIALLQERFRELERVKERRVGRELAEQLLTTPRPRPRRELSSQPHLNLTQPPQDLSLSLGLNSQSHLIDPRAVKDPAWSSSSPKRPRESFENPDVDTSLHL